MSEVAQKVILKQISVMKDELNQLEQTVKDYFLWLDMQRSPTLRAADGGDGAFWTCSNCNFVNYHSWQTCARCDAPHPKSAAIR